MAETPMLARMLGPLRSVGPTVAANLLNQAVVALTQLLVIPLLIAQWGVSGFGTWLLLTAIPNYLTISDLGFTSSAKSDMSVRAVRGDLDGAQVTSSSVAALLGVAVFAISLIYVPLSIFVDWVPLLNLTDIDSATAIAVLLLGLLQLSSYQAFLLSASVLRAAGRPALEVVLSAVCRLLETIAIVTAAWSGFGFIGAAAAWAGTRLVTTVIIWAVIYARLGHLAPTLNRISYSRIKELFAPSIAYMLIPLANAISIQGTVLVLGAVTAPAVVAIFTAMRVVTRMGVSAANTLNFAFTPQYSYAAGAGDTRRFNGLLRAHAIVLAAGTACYLLVVWLAGSYFVALLSRASAPDDSLALALLAVAAAGEMVWTLSLAVASATNKVGRLSTIWLALSTAGLLASTALVSGYGIHGIAASIAATHLVMATASLVWLRSPSALRQTTQHE